METITISFSLPKDIADKAKVKAEETYKTRSEYIKDLIIADTKQIELSL